MRAHWMAALVALLVLAGVTTISSRPDSPGPAALEATPPNPCTLVTVQSIERFQRSVQRALRSAEQDARANGQTGAYAVAATNSRDLLKRAEARIDQAIQTIAGNGSRVTTYAQGGQVKEFVRPTFEWISQAGHWALISAAYHRSTDARDAFEGTLVALGELQRVYGESGRCFMSNYVP